MPGGSSSVSHGGGVDERRALRSQYLALINLINDESDDISRVDSDKFNSILDQVENLHQHVRKPREQVVDAEALLGITNTLLSCVKAHSKLEGLTPSEFVTFLLREFYNTKSVEWKKLGKAVPHVVTTASGCCTMLGPMNTELKQRKPTVYRKRERPTESSRPDELEETTQDDRTETDANMATMFEILRKNKMVRLERLVLNRNSFAQTVENIFALSFLAKDGRVEIKTDDEGWHLVSPRNAPSASAIASGEVSYSHFVFRFDFRDWEFMKTCIADVEELMPHRNSREMASSPEPGSPLGETRVATNTKLIRKVTRNRGFVAQEKTAATEPSNSCDYAEARVKQRVEGDRKLSKDAR